MPHSFHRFGTQHQRFYPVPELGNLRRFLENLAWGAVQALGVVQANGHIKAWEQTLLLVTYDEHGGCYDHVAPPWNAATPDAVSNPGEAGFRFNRFGVRVPALLISPYIEAGTVFRSTTEVPYDHTSILATIRDWLSIPNDKMLPSTRIKAAPSFDNVLTRATPRTDFPTIEPQESLASWRVMPDIALNDLQKSIMVAMESKRLGRTLAVHEVEALLAKMPTRRLMLSHLKMRG